MLKRFNFHILIAVVNLERGRTIQLANGEEVKIATVYDLMTSQYGVQRFEHELEATSYDDASSKYTPLARTNYRYQKELVTKVAKEFAQNAIDTGGRSMIIMGLVSTIGLTPILFIVQFLT